MEDRSVDVIGASGVIGQRLGPGSRPPGGLRWALRRIAQLWWLHGYLDLIWVARDVRAAVIYYLSDIVVNLASVTATFLLAERFAGIGAWTRDQIVFMLGYALLARGTLDIVFNYNVSSISRRLGRGQLDHTLVQPQPIWMVFLTEGFAPFSGSAVLVPGVVLLAWSLTRLGLAVSPIWLIAFAANVVASAAITIAFAFLWGSLAFWAPRGAEEISASALGILHELRPFPLDGLSPLLIGAMLTVVPAGLAAWYPCRALLGIDGGSQSYALTVTPLIAVAFLALTTRVFQRGLKQYGRTGSQRYTDFGHRR